MAESGRAPKTASPGFSVVAAWCGRKYKLMPADLQVVLVEKIRRTLSKFTGLPQDDIVLFHQSRRLKDHEKGKDFGLKEGMVLIMRRVSDLTPDAPAAEPPATVAPLPEQPTAPLGEAPPPPPSRGRTPPAQEHQDGEAPGGAVSPAAPPPPPRYPTPSGSVRSSTPPNAVPCRSRASTPDQRTAPPSPHSAVSTFRSEEEAPPSRTSPARRISPQRPALRLGLSTEQIKLQERLIHEAQQTGNGQVPHISELIRQIPLTEGPSLVTPRHPLQSTYPSSPSPAELEARIMHLRAENQALRLERTRMLSAEPVRDWSTTLPTTPAPAKTSDRSRSPVTDRWLRTAGIGNEPAVEMEKKELVRRCSELSKMREAMEKELQAMRQQLGEEKRDFMLKWEQDHLKWAQRQQQMIQAWEDEKAWLLAKYQHLPLSERKEFYASQRGALMMDANQQSMMYEMSKQEWEAQREGLQRQVQHLRDRKQMEDLATLKQQQEALDKARARKAAVESEVTALKQKLIQSRHDTEQNKLFVVAASQSLTELRGVVVEKTGVKEDVAKCIVNAVTEKAMVGERVHVLNLQNEQLLQRFQKETSLRKHLHNTLEDIKGAIRVIVRMRPVLQHEAPQSSDEDSLTVGDSGTVSLVDSSTISVSTPSTGTKDFSFYRVLGPEVGQDEVFLDVRPLLQSTLDGFNVCVMAYGQTGSGKTYTILGDGSAMDTMSRASTYHSRGVLPRTLEELFELLRQTDASYELRCSMVELYLDSLKDLLHPEQRKCELRQLPSGLQVNCSEHTIRTPQEAMAVLKAGAAHRQVHSTLVNPQSSRSHALFTINVRVSNQQEGFNVASKLVFVDLAGSERVKYSHSKGERLKEAQNINKSLSALGDVVAALSQPRGGSTKFVPYRNSKLTVLLQDAIGGNSKTLMFACICPSLGATTNVTETVSTLVFASRVRHVQNPYLRNITVMQNEVLENAAAGGRSQTHTPTDDESVTRQ